MSFHNKINIIDYDFVSIAAYLVHHSDNLYHSDSYVIVEREMLYLRVIYLQPQFLYLIFLNKVFHECKVFAIIINNYKINFLLNGQIRSFVSREKPRTGIVYSTVSFIDRNFTER
jgi:hypothetical protein